MEQVFAWILLAVTFGCFAREACRRQLPEGRVENFTQHAFLLSLTWGSWFVYWIATKIARTFEKDISLPAGAVVITIFIIVGIGFITRKKWRKHV